MTVEGSNSYNYCDECGKVMRLSFEGDFMNFICDYCIQKKKDDKRKQKEQKEGQVTNEKT